MWSSFNVGSTNKGILTLYDSGKMVDISSNGLGCEYSPLRKHWYHILTGIYLIQNDSYELTEEQMSNIRLCHARQMTQEIYDYIQATLKQWKDDMEQ